MTAALPIAIAEQDGCAPFHINAFSARSSLLPLNAEGLAEWVGGDDLRVDRTITVSTMRLDTFMNLARIAEVEFLKIDAQGADLSVVRSAGSRLRDGQEENLTFVRADRATC